MSLVLNNRALMFYCFNLRTCISVFVKVLTEKNVNTCTGNEPIFSDVYRNVNYIGPLAKCA